MVRFRYEPTGQTIEATGRRARRYRRHHAFTELTDTDNHYQSPTDSLPESSSSLPEAPESTPDAPDQPTKDHESHTNAPHAPAPVFDDLPLTHIHEHTVSQVLAWVDNDPHRAQAALEAEKAGRNRVTLTAKLRRIP